MDRDELNRGAARTATALRNQLAQMTAISQMLEDSVWDEKGKGHLAELNQSIYRMLRIAGRLELCERLARGDPELQDAPVDLAELTADLGRRMESLLDRVGVELTVRCPERLLAWADRALVEQLLLELTANAARAVGGGQTRAVKDSETAEPGKQVTVTLEQVKNAAVFTVEDNGPGVPPGQMELLFPQDGGEQQPDWRKTGNGIAIAQRIARLHGGALVASCAAGRGLRVSASIPLNRGRGESFQTPGPGIDEGGFDSALVGLSHLLPPEVFRREDYE